MTGSEIKRFRLALHLSQTEFGEQLGFKNPQIQVSQLEGGNRVITDRVAKSIEKWKEAEKLKKELSKANGTD